MSEILRRLHQDHTNCQRLLAILDRQIEVLENEKTPDWDILRGVFQYFLTYPDTAHHPLENLIVKRLASKDPAAAAAFMGLEEEHRELSDTLQHIAAVTQRLVPVVRATYLDLLRSFVARQRDHVQREETGFLPTAKRLLDARDWQQLESIAPKITDPLSDPADGRFLALQRHLASSDRAGEIAR
jgi:hemerythrin-like domain-containing protein